MNTRKYGSISLGLLTFGPLTAHADEPVTTPEPAKAPSAEEQIQMLEEVTVRAKSEAVYKVEKASSTKYTAPLLDTAKTINVIPAQALQESGATSLTEALRMTPGITLGAGEGGNPVGDRPFIRGADSQSSTFIDGMRDIGSQSREVFNLEQVEVVKGPNGAVDGRGAAGGSINLVSKTPKSSNFVEGNIGLGTDNYQRATIDGNWKLNDNAAFRLNAMAMESDVAGRDLVNFSRKGIAPSLALGLNSPTRVVLSLYTMKSEELPDTGIPYNNPFGATSPNVGLNGNGSPIHVDRNTFYGLANRDFRNTSNDSATAVIEHDLSEDILFKQTLRVTRSSQDYIWTQPDDSKGNILLNGTVWRRINSRISNTDTVASQSDFSGTFLMADMKHSFSTGVELGSDQGRRHGYNVNTDTDPATAGNQTTCPPGALGAAGNFNCTTVNNPNPWDPWAGAITPNSNYIDTNVETASLYAFDTMTLNEQWLLNAGLRLDNYATKVDTAATSTAPRTVVKANDTLVNYQLGAVFKPAANGSIYASVGSSSTPVNSSMGEGSEVQTLTGVTKDLEPEKSLTYEIGTKWDVLNEQAQLTAAVFRIETSNARTTDASGLPVMSGNKRVQGVELGLSGNITDTWQVMTGYTRLDSEIVNGGYINAGTTAAPNWVVSPYNGNRFPNTPKNSASVWSTWELAPRITVAAGGNYMGKVYGNVANTKWVPSYTRLDAMASFEVSKNVSLQLNIQNLTDKVYFDKAYASHYANIAPARSGTLTLKVKY